MMSEVVRCGRCKIVSCVQGGAWQAVGRRCPHCGSVGVWVKTRPMSSDKPSACKKGSSHG